MRAARGPRSCRGSGNANRGGKQSGFRHVTLKVGAPTATDHFTVAMLPQAQKPNSSWSYE